MKPPPKRKALEPLKEQEPEPKTKCTPNIFFQESQTALDKRVTDAIITFLADSGIAFKILGRSSSVNLMKTANKKI